MLISNWITAPGVTGMVYEEDGVTPVSGIFIYLYTGDPCGDFQYAGGTYIYPSDNGIYSIDHPASGYILSVD